MKNIVCFFLLIILCQDAHSQFNPDNVSWHRDNSFIRVKRIHADIFRVNSIRENGVIVVKDFYLDGTLRGIGQDKNGEMHGTYVGYYKDGSLKDSGTFHKGYKWGRWRTYYKNGKIAKDYVYRSNELHGYQTRYDTSGNLLSKGRYKDGDLVENDSTFYIGTNKLHYLMHYNKDNVFANKLKVYYPNGALKRVENLLEARYIANSGKLYNEEGVEIPYTPFIKSAKFTGHLENYLLKNIQYPEKSFKEKVEGIVYVRIEIDEHGNVILAVPLLGLDEDCNAEATRICKTLHYTPRITDDEPVGEYRTVAVPFYINKMIQAQTLAKDKEEQKLRDEQELNLNPFR